jgi:hypothetical protein
MISKRELEETPGAPGDTWPAGIDLFGETLNEFSDEQMVAKDEKKQRRSEKTKASRKKSSKANFMDESFWDEYKRKTDPMSRTVFGIHQVLSSHKFDAAIGVLIFVNSIAIGVQTEYELSGKDATYLMVLDNIFLFIYAVELGCRFVAYGCRCLTNGWVRFDAVLIGTGVFTAVLESTIGTEDDSFGPIMVLRVLILLKLARAVRLFFPVQGDVDVGAGPPFFCTNNVLHVRPDVPYHLPVREFGHRDHNKRYSVAFSGA